MSRHQKKNKTQQKNNPNNGIAVLKEETIFPWRMILWKKREGAEQETTICFKIAAEEGNYSFWLLLQVRYLGWMVKTL